MAAIITAIGCPQYLNYDANFKHFLVPEGSKLGHSYRIQLQHCKAPSCDHVPTLPS